MLPFIDKVSFEVVESEQQRWKLFEQGEFDLISVPNKQLGEITSDEKRMLQLTKKGFITKQFPKISSRWIGFNMSDDLVGHGEKAKYLRKAIAFAIDYKDYIYHMSQNTNLRATSLFNPSIPGYNPSHITRYDFNLRRAKEYLRLSGYQNLNLTYQTRGDQELNLREAKLFTKYLKRIGIKLKVEVNSFRQFLAKGRKGELTHFWTDGWIYDYPDAENILSLLYSKNAPGVNKSVFKNQSFDRLYAQLYLTPDKINRHQLFYDMEEIVHQELPWIMLMHESSYILHKERVQNFRKSYFIRNYVKYLNLLTY